MFPKTGLLERLENFAYQGSAWKKVGETSYTWLINALHANEPTAVNTHVYASDTLSKQYDLSDAELMSESRKQATTIDKYGNVLDRIDSLKDNTGYSQTSTSFEYDNDEASWWLNKLTSKTTTIAQIDRNNSINGLTITAAGANDTSRVITETYPEYDLVHRLPKQHVTTAGDANYLSVDQDTGQITVSESQPETQSLTVDTTYNTYGQPNTVSQTAMVFDSNEETSWSSTTRTTTITYTDDGYFNKTISNNLEHTTTIETDKSTGLQKSVTAPNGVVTTTKYDGFGRPKQTSTTGFPTQFSVMQSIEQGDNAPSFAAYKILVVQAGQPSVTQFVDNAGRVLRVETEGFSSSQDYVVDTEYDSRGFKTFESLPYELGSTRYGTTYSEYDALGRLRTKSVNQTDGILNISYVHDGFSTEITAGALESMSRVYNAREQLIQTTDSLSGVTEYAYDAMGNPLLIRDANDNDITATYNGLGHKLSVADPNMGSSYFITNAFGEVEYELDANGDVIEYQLDSLGRVTQRVTSHSADENLDSTAAFSFDTGTNCRSGELCSESENQMSRSYQYDSSGRVVQTTTTLEGQKFITSQAYDSNFGRLKSLQYPNGLTIAYSYNDRGYLTSESNAASGYVYRKVTNMDAFGNIAEDSRGDDVLTGTYFYHRASGQMRSSYVEATDGTLVQHHFYETYDQYGNIKLQQNYVSQTKEEFDYDELHRLTSNRAYDQSLNILVQEIDYDYDAVGNFKYKTDYSIEAATAYVYGNGARSSGGNAGPNAVRQVDKLSGGTVNFSYDNKGNMLSGDGLTANYFAYGKPQQLTRNGKTTSFSYGSDRMRYKQTRDNKTTFYVDKLFEVEGNNWRAYISNAAVLNYTAADAANGVSEDISLRFLFKDRLGSATTLTDEEGNVTERRHYDPFGKPRGVETPLTSSKLLAFGGEVQLTNRGFTDHEHLDDQELIHMNGRVYDYNLGRFMSVDPFVHSGSQGLNPYFYIMNNPLSGTDPSGYKFAIASMGKHGFHSWKHFRRCISDLPTVCIVREENQEVGRYHIE